MNTFWISTPADSVLSEMQGWAKIDRNHYAAIRHHLLVVQRRGKVLNGPEYKSMDWPVGAVFTKTDEITKVTKYTYGIQESVTSAVTAKLSQEVLTKAGLSAGLDITTLGAKLSAEIQSRIGTELTKSLESGLFTTRTYEVEVHRIRDPSLSTINCDSYSGISICTGRIIYNWNTSACAP